LLINGKVVVWPALFWPVALMAAVVLAANVLVQYPVRWAGLQDWLTWGALTYPLAFLITDLTHRRFGAALTRRMIYCGFVVAVMLSIWWATPRIALASGLAFLLAQLLDVSIFARLKARAWWVAPLASSVVASGLDTALFFGLAFSCSTILASILATVGIDAACTPELPWVQWAWADYGVKLLMALAMVGPYGLCLRWLRGLQAARLA
jgi:queuosine precursor transporter